MLKNLLRLSLFCFLIVFESNFLNASNNFGTTIHPIVINGFDGNLLAATEDLYGNKYLVVNHFGALVFNNDTVQTGGTGLYKTDPSGNLIWDTPIIYGSYFISKIIIDQTEIFVYGFFYDSVSWGNFNVYNNGNNFTTPYGLRSKIDINGNIISLEDFPIGSEGINGDAIIHQEDGFYITSSFDSILHFGSSTIHENQISLLFDESDQFLGYYDTIASPQWAINLGGASFEAISEIKLNRNANTILLSGFFAKPPDSALFYPNNTFLYLEIDHNGNLVNSRSLEVDISTYWTFSINKFGTIITREYNDSSESLFKANTIYNGLDHFGYYKYEFGLFTPPIEGVAYGADTFLRQDNMSSQFILENNLVADVLIHPFGITSDNGQIINAPFTINGFDIDSMKFAWNVRSNKELINRSLKSGSQFLTRELHLIIDSIVSLDTISIVKNPFEPALLLTNVVNCKYFKPEIHISLNNDTLFLSENNLSVKWYYNFNEVLGVPRQLPYQGDGIYFAEVKNFYGCTFNSDTLNISGIKSSSMSDHITTYPNPTNANISFKIEQSYNMPIVIYDMNGRPLLKAEISKNKNTISVADLKTGIYFFSIITPDYNYHGKIIKL